MTRSNGVPTFIRLTFVMFMYWIVAALCMHSFMERWGFREGSQGFNLGNMLTYSAPRPFAYRVFMPMLVNATADAIPAAIKTRIQPSLEQYSRVYQQYFKYNVRPFSFDSWTPDYALKYHITYFYDFCFLFGTMLILRALLQQCFPGMEAVSDVAPAAFVLLLPPVYLQGGYLYDFPELFFMAGCYYAAFSGRLWWLLLLLPLSVLNKESNILLPVLLLPLLFMRQPQLSLKLWIPQLLPLILAAVLAGIAFAATRIVFANAGGSQVSHWFVSNLHFWATLRPYLDFTSIYAAAIPFPKPQNIVFLVPLLLLAGYRWAQKPQWLKWLLIVAVAVNAPLLLLFGKHDEIRNLSLIFVPLFLVCCHSWALIYRHEPIVATADSNNNSAELTTKLAL